MKYYCNPMNLEYTYQFQRYLQGPEEYSVFREAADPSLAYFKGLYYLFPSMTDGFFTGRDMVEWDFHTFLSDMPVYDYAPDVRVVGDYLYFCASNGDRNCSFYRTKDPLTEPFEEIPGSFPFWDPNLFEDEDGKIYFYWGCSNNNPIYGVELDPGTMEPLSAPVALIDSRASETGYERPGENHENPDTDKKAEIESTVALLMGLPAEEREKMGYGSTPEEVREKVSSFMSDRPFIEGPWMTKYSGKYYLQYAVPGTELNIYGDGCYVGERPLGPFALAKNNSYSYHPGGFITGAGHGSTLLDAAGQGWHISSMRISCNHMFERRLGLWKAGVDADGELYCDQAFGDWPVNAVTPAFSKPDFMLLSYKAEVKASSGTGQGCVTDEDIRTWWEADPSDKNAWVEVDLGRECDIHAVQVNFADGMLKMELPEGLDGIESAYEARYMARVKQPIRWLLEYSADGETFEVMEDKSNAETSLPHDLVVMENGGRARYLRLTVVEQPFRQAACISGIRVFGFGEGNPPGRVEEVVCEKTGDLDVGITWQGVDAVGYEVYWGYAPDKLYHSKEVLGQEHTKIGAFIKGQKAWGRIDAFNRCGITRGAVFELYK